MISFVVPTYNCAKYLDETVGSVISQLSEDIELILVDDGSDDGTAEMLAKYRDLPGKKIKILLHEHRGVSSARNAGIDAAKGDWVSFMDSDDCLIPGFFDKCRKIVETNADLYIFSFENVDCLTESVEPSTVDDRIYGSSSDFADEYIRTRHLLVYSACNKFYKKALLDRHGIRFREGLEFGEDRLFNYDYLCTAGRIETSSVRMFRYMHRNPESASNRSFPDYFNTIMMLHKAKMDCFTELSKGTSEDEKRAFIGYDISTETERMIDRFDLHPEEKARNLPLINKLIFEEKNGKSITLIPAYDEHIGPDNWFKDPYCRKICLSELSKRFMYSDYKKG